MFSVLQTVPSGQCFTDSGQCLSDSPVVSVLQIVPSGQCETVVSVRLLCVDCSQCETGVC